VVLWLWSGREGVFSHETALALHELSDVMPATRHVTVPPVVGASPREGSGRDRAAFRGGSGVADGVGRSGSGDLRTIEDGVAAHVSPEWIEQAARQGVERGLFSSAAVKKARGRKPVKARSA
jgi:hypothetical protein